MLYSGKTSNCNVFSLPSTFRICIEVRFFLVLLPCSLSNCCRVGHQLLKAEKNECEEEMVASFGNLADVNTGLNGLAGPRGKVRFSLSALLPDVNC